MPRPSEDDRDAVDRAFAELVAGYHLTSDRPDPLLDRRSANDAAADATSRADTTDAPLTTETSLTAETPLAADNSCAGGTSLPPGQPGPESHATAEHPLNDNFPMDEHSRDRRLEEIPFFHFDGPVDPSPEPSPSDTASVGAPLLPLPKPAWPVLVAWIAMGYATLAVLAAVMGVPLPRWAGWIALGGFVGGFGLLVARLPRNRPPDAGDGAVL